MTIEPPFDLARWLAAEFHRRGISGWTSTLEHRLFDDALARRLGFTPRADVAFEDEEGRRVAIELEIARADPVANQAKFAVAASADLRRNDDVLVSMISPRITRGRRNLVSAFAGYLRTSGVNAFTVSLLPGCSPAQLETIADQSPGSRVRTLEVAKELQRVKAVVQPFRETDHRIHFAGDVTDVIANVWAWNEAFKADPDFWGRRTIQFFVFDPHSGRFAPSKFCAFIPAARPGRSAPPPTMTQAVYASLDESETRFDGNIAWKHLVGRLGFRRAPPRDLDDGGAGFERWRSEHASTIRLRGDTTILVPPAWY